MWADSGEHLADRYRQFLLIALGESVLALSLAYTRGLYNVASTAAFVIGFAAAVLLWRIYFYRAGQILADAIAASNNPIHLGRVAAFAHWIMVLGVVVTVIGFELVIPNPLGHTMPAWAVVVLGGPALFVAGRARFEYVVFARVSRPRLIGVLVLAIAAPLAAFVPPVFVTLTAVYERTVQGEQDEIVRHAAAAVAKLMVDYSVEFGMSTRGEVVRIFCDMLEAGYAQALIDVRDGKVGTYGPK